jgi:hypothetical protein
MTWEGSSDRIDRAPLPAFAGMTFSSFRGYDSVATTGCFDMSASPSPSRSPRIFTEPLRAHRDIWNISQRDIRLTQFPSWLVPTNPLLYCFRFDPSIHCVARFERGYHSTNHACGVRHGIMPQEEL